MKGKGVGREAVRLLATAGGGGPWDRGPCGPDRVGGGGWVRSGCGQPCRPKGSPARHRPGRPRSSALPPNAIPPEDEQAAIGQGNLSAVVGQIDRPAADAKAVAGEERASRAVAVLVKNLKAATGHGPTPAAARRRPGRKDTAGRDRSVRPRCPGREVRSPGGPECLARPSRKTPATRSRSGHARR